MKAVLFCIGFLALAIHAGAAITAHALGCFFVMNLVWSFVKRGEQ